MGSKKIKKILIIAGVIFLVGAGATTLVVVKNKANTEQTQQMSTPEFVVQEAEGIKFKGKSDAKDIQKIALDLTKGKVNKTYVTDGQEVQAGTVLFDYYNEQAKEEVDDLNRQITTLNSQIEKSKQANAAPKTGEGAQVQDSQKSGDELGNNLKSLIAKRDNLKNKITTQVKAEVNGIVSLSQGDKAQEYMKVISKETRIICEASEFDVNQLKAGAKVDIKVISNNEVVSGTIEKVEQVPTTSADQKSSGYKFYIKPDKEVKIGFSTEVNVKQSGIAIPKECVIDENGKLSVTRKNNGNTETVEISAKLVDGKYILENDSLKVGDTILIFGTPSQNEMNDSSIKG